MPTPKIVIVTDDTGKILAYGYDTELDGGIPAPVNLPPDFGNMFGLEKYSEDAGVIVADPDFVAPPPSVSPALLEAVAEPVLEAPVVIDRADEMAIAPTPLSASYGGVVDPDLEPEAKAAEDVKPVEDVKPDEVKPIDAVKVEAVAAQVEATLIVETP